MKYFKSILSVSVVLFASLLSACSDDTSSPPEEPVDTFDAAVVCPAEGMNAYGEPNRGTFTDVRDGQVYKYTTIGNQVWMAENLKFDAPYSVCYDKIEGYCETFGRFYSLHVNGEYFDLFNQELLDTICPAGWHVPSVNEWNVLVDNMGSAENRSIRLRSSTVLGNVNEYGSDDCAFNSLPAGVWWSTGIDGESFNTAAYWTSSAKSMDISYAYIIDCINVRIADNFPKMSIRCIKN